MGIEDSHAAHVREFLGRGASQLLKLAFITRTKGKERPLLYPGNISMQEIFVNVAIIVVKPSPWKNQ